VTKTKPKNQNKPNSIQSIVVWLKKNQ